MADGVPITAGTGTTIATDDTGATGHVQLVKLAYSADGSPTLITADANGLKVNASGSAVPVTDNGGSLTVDGTVAVSGSVAVTGTFYQATQPVSLASVPSHAVTNAGTFAVQAAQSGAWTVVTTGGAVSSGGTATLTNVNDAATNATLLSANSSRMGFSIFNDSTSTLYMKFGTTASSTSYSVRIDPYGYYEMFGHGVYTGRIDGIWSVDSSGAARVTEW